VDFLNYEDKKVDQITEPLRLILSHPRSYMAIGYVMSEIVLKLDQLRAEFKEYREKIESPEFIRKLTETEIERSLKIRSENLEKSLTIEREKYEYEIMQKLADIVCFVGSILKRLRDECESSKLPEYASAMEDSRNDFLRRISDLNLKLVGEIGERVRFDARYHESIGQGGGESEFEVVSFGCVWENPHEKKDIVLKKALIRPC